jgi:flagellar biosynthetic protein FliR
MIEAGPAVILSAFVLFCRIGACLLVMPGFSSPRVPAQVRLFLALAVTLALSPLLIAEVLPSVDDLAPATIARVAVSELMTGLFIGLLGRAFFAALETLASAVTMAIGYGNIPGALIDETQPVPELVSMITLGAVLLLFLTGQHWEILRALAASYSALPLDQSFSARFALSELADTLSDAFFLALRVTAPFIVYSLIVHLAVGLINKLVAQIPVYFISLPFVLAGGLFLLYLTAVQLLRLFVEGFSAWLAVG